MSTADGNRILGGSTQMLYLPDVRNDLAEEIQRNTPACCICLPSNALKTAAALVDLIDDLHSSKLASEAKTERAIKEVVETLDGLKPPVSHLTRAHELMSTGDTRGSYRHLELSDVEALRLNDLKRLTKYLESAEVSLGDVATAAKATKLSCKDIVVEGNGALQRLTQKAKELTLAEAELQTDKTLEVKNELRQIQIALVGIYGVLGESTRHAEKRDVAAAVSRNKLANALESAGERASKVLGVKAKRPRNLRW